MLKITKLGDKSLQEDSKQLRITNKNTQCWSGGKTWCKIFSLHSKDGCGFILSASGHTRGSEIPVSVSRGSTIMSSDHLSVYYTDRKTHCFRANLKNNLHTHWTYKRDEKTVVHVTVHNPVSANKWNQHVLVTNNFTWHNVSDFFNWPTNTHCIILQAQILYLNKHAGNQLSIWEKLVYKNGWEMGQPTLSSLDSCPEICFSQYSDRRLAGSARFLAVIRALI